MSKLAKALAVLGWVVSVSSFAATQPVTLSTTDLPALYKTLTAEPVADLCKAQQRQLALLVLIRTSETKPLKPETLEAAKAELAKIAAAANNDPEVLAIAANIRAMEAGLAKSPMSALVISKEVTRTLDRLVKDNPDNGGVLMQRGSNALYAPPVAGRGSIAVTDFETLLSGRFQLDEASTLRTRELLGQAYEKVGRKADARKAFEALAASSNPYWQRRGKDLLQGAGS